MLTLKGVGKKLRASYMASEISSKEIMSVYKKNKKEADNYEVFGLSVFELMQEEKHTHNPLLREKLNNAITLHNAKTLCSNNQNIISLAKLKYYRESALGLGLRPVMKSLRKIAISGNIEAKLCLMLIQIEFANLSAKKLYNKKKVIYERKDILLARISSLLNDNGWKCGISSNTGKNASYIIYVYLPNGVQLSWHCNDYRMLYCYDNIECDWDGLPCSTLEKLLTFVNNKFNIGDPLVEYDSSIAA